MPFLGRKWGQWTLEFLFFFLVLSFPLPTLFIPLPLNPLLSPFHWYTGTIPYLVRDEWIKIQVAGEYPLPSHLNLFFPISFQSCCISPIPWGRNFHTVKRGWSLNLFCPLWSSWDTQDREMSCGFTESRSPVFIAGKKAEGGGRWSCVSRDYFKPWEGEGDEGGLRNQEKCLWEIFFYFLWVPNCDKFW